MDQLKEFLSAVRTHGTSAGRFRGLLHILIGRTITRTDATPVSNGMTWRAAAALLKKHRWDRDAVRELGLDPAALPPRDREKFWYVAIAQGAVGTPEAAAEADALVESLRELGYHVTAGRGESPSSPTA